MPPLISMPAGLPLRRPPRIRSRASVYQTGDGNGLKGRVHEVQESVQLIQLALAGKPDGSIAASFRQIQTSGDRKSLILLPSYILPNKKIYPIYDLRA